VLAGSATLEQYERLFAAPIARLRAGVVMQAPAITAMVHSRLLFSSWPKNAVAYPPDGPLPEYEASLVASLERGATEPVESLPRRGPAHPRARRLGNPADRAGDAIVFLSLGGHDALGLRREVWAVVDGIWDFAPEVWALAEEAEIYRHGLGDYHGAGLPIRCDHSQPNSIGPDCYDTYAEVARHVGLPIFRELDE